MKKNVAGQSIGAELVSNVDGTAFTGTVTVYITGDNGTQTIGTVGAGVATNAGRGVYTYAPAQAETNFDFIVFTFTGTSAIPTSVELYTELITSITPATSAGAATTTQLTNFQDLYTDLQNRVRVQTGLGATQAQAKRYINIALQDMALGFDYKMPWLERHAFIQTYGKYATGTCTATQGSTAVVGQGTLWNTANAWGVNNTRAGGKIIIAGGLEVYEVSLVVSDTAMTINPAYNSATSTAGTYIYEEDTFALATDFLRPIDQQLFAPALNILLIGRNEFRRRYPRRNIPGRPRVAAMLDDSFAANTVPVNR